MIGDFSPLSASSGGGCDEPPRTPVETYNRPGLAAISYRFGVHASFKETMLASLSARTGLHRGEAADFSVALVDAFAVMADVLTFYQERIANESYLRTATERRSALELSRLIDYRPRPGVAASAYLAFTLEDAPGAPDQAAPPLAIGARLKVQSLPGPGETPQTFETIEAIEARPEWNAMRPLRTQAQPIFAAMQSAILRGANLNIKAGDLILVAADSNDAKRVVKVTHNAERGETRVDFVEDPPDPPPFFFPIFPPWPINIFLADRPKLTNHVVATHILSFGWRQHDLNALALVHRWSLPALSINLRRQAAHRPVAPETGVFAFRQRAAIFGHNAPKYLSLPDTQRTATGAYPPPGWDSTPRKLADESANRDIYLDRTYPEVIAGSWAVLESDTQHKIYRVEETSETSRADFALSGKTTRLRLDSADGFSDFALRETTAYVDSEKLELADLPIPNPVEGASVTLDQTYFGLKIGQKVALTGTRAELEGVVDSEVLTIADATFAGGYTTLQFQRALEHSYVRDSVTLNANVALATHGETVLEILGSGDASRPFQRLALRQSPLTYISSDAPSGAQSTLELRVDGLLWREAPSFFGAAPKDRVYVTRRTDDGQTMVEFGDGVVGARPPTGIENIKAVYRKGGGAAGNVEAGRLTLLPARPVGVRAVNNLLAASGATDPETLADIRRNAALTVLTLDRIVSLQDYEDFARAFPGVGKALASWSWSGKTRGIFVTIAGAGGADTPESGQVYLNLLSAMRKAGDPHVPLRVKSYRQAFFRLAATVIVAPDADQPSVLAAVEFALRAAFSFETRSFGQDVALSEVMAAIQAVQGVTAVDIDQFFRTDDPNSGGLSPLLAAAAPIPGEEGAPLAAELLTLDPRPLILVGARA
ncbi:MAG: putative baseplate assembly protein [Methylocystis sp.]|nr:putative baseplate assembly protein [Methylocystis sp.]